MVFRADAATQQGREQAESYLIPTSIEGSQRPISRRKFADIVDECGPVIDSYPSWHPLVSNHNSRNPICNPGSDCGYEGLDHTRYFVNGFITCPYDSGQRVLDSVEAFPAHPVASVTAERLEDVQFYNADTTPILVKCKWGRSIQLGGMIPPSLAIPLLLEQEIPAWRWSGVAETWESMRPYFLGFPHGSRSSLFVSQETGQMIKKVWNCLIHTGMFGPIKV